MFVGSGDQKRIGSITHGFPQSAVLLRNKPIPSLNPTELLPAEAGRLEEIVSYGLKSFAHDLVIRKLSPPSSGSVPSCWRMYSWMTSSVTLPLDATK